MRSEPPDPARPGPSSGRALLRSLIRFGRALRVAGIPVTVEQFANVARALSWIDVGAREQVFCVTRALLVTRREDVELFEQLFLRFWSGHAGTEPPAPRGRRTPSHAPASRRRFTIVDYAAMRARLDAEESEVADRAGRFTDVEALRRRRFATMTDEELEAVRRLIRQMRWGLARRTSRRQRPRRAGPSIDFRRVLREASRLGALPARLPRRRRIDKNRPLVLLADISGSMEKYSRLVLQFFHSALRSLPDVETFVFGTRLSRITPQLRLRNIDRAIDEAARAVADWAGGTRIGECLGAFNREWSRRVLRRGAVVAIISDGCDLGDPDALRREMRYLQHRCHRLIWLNPHRLHPGYEPRVAGMAAALPFVHDFLPLDDLASLEAFAVALASLPRAGPAPRSATRPASPAMAPNP